MINRNGAYILVDGQFGSTGKGVLGAYMASEYAKKVDMVITNAGPNSGHTFYHGTEKHVLKQLPTFSVYAHLSGVTVPTFISPGAIIDPEILNKEVEKYQMRVFLHRKAALISQQDKENEHSGTIAAVAGTRQGVGSALARKIARDPDAVVESYNNWSSLITLVDVFPDYFFKRLFLEVSQGFSLGINSRFYPKVTSRECTAAQAIADARIPPSLYAGCMMVIRTFPIRVGNFEGHSSGDCYADQKELSWDEIGVQEELTTVTQRVRRVFSFSQIQFEESLKANRPNLIFVNFMNYLKPEKQEPFIRNLQMTAYRILGRHPKFLLGFGPHHRDTKMQPMLTKKGI